MRVCACVCVCVCVCVRACVRVCGGEVSYYEGVYAEGHKRSDVVDLR